MLSIRQQKYKQNRLSGMCCEKSAVEAGYSVKYARAFAYKIDALAKLGMKDALNKAGLTDEYLASKAKHVIDKSDSMTGLGYFQAVCKMKGHLVDKPLIDQSIHEHVTVIIKHPEPKSDANRDQGNTEGIRTDGEAGQGARLINLS